MNLRELTDRVIADVLASGLASVDIINDINPSFPTCKEMATFSTALKIILTDACRNTQNGQLKISARIFHNLQVLYIRHNDWRSREMIETRIAPVQEYIARLGGCLFISNNKTSGATISFTCLTEPAPAPLYTPAPVPSYSRNMPLPALCLPSGYPAR